MNSEIKTMCGLIGRVAMQCVDPRSGKTGDWLFSGDNHRDPTSAISPLFPDCVGVFEWCRANGWKGYGYDYVYEPTTTPCNP